MRARDSAFDRLGAFMTIQMFDGSSDMRCKGRVATVRERRAEHGLGERGGGPRQRLLQHWQRPRGTDLRERIRRP